MTGQDLPEVSKCFLKSLVPKYQEKPKFGDKNLQKLMRLLSCVY
jgi:hypothetical protein